MPETDTTFTADDKTGNYLPTPMNFRVELDVFRGPLDLLLYLVRKHGVEITEIPIAPITEQFVAYLNAQGRRRRRGRVRHGQHAGRDQIADAPANPEEVETR
jgi:hypothetical protein